MVSPVVSVLLPVRNAAPTLALALRSLLTQTFADFEVLVLDDGSTDSGMAIAHGFGDVRIRVTEDPVSRGLAERLNLGIDLAHGRYVARMDADDVAFPERLARQVAFLDAHPDVDLVGARAIAFRPDGTVVGLLPFRATHAELVATPWRGIPLAHPTWMGRAQWFRRHRYRTPEVRRAEDQELLLRASADSRYACLDAVLLGYRQPHRYELRRTLVARIAYSAAQLAHFARRRDIGAVLRTLAFVVAKMALDLVAAVPGLSRVFWVRMGAPAAEADRSTLAKLLA